MRSAFAAILTGFTLPFGRTSGRRIEFDGPNAEIRVFDTSNRLRLRISSSLPSSITFFTGDVNEADGGTVSALVFSSGGELYEVLRVESPVDSSGTGDELAMVELRSRSQDGSEAPMIALKARISSDDLRIGVLDDSAGTRNQPMGTAVLVAGTVTPLHTTVTASSRIFLSRLVAGGTLGNLSVGAITAGTSFVINSDNAADTSTVAYLILEPL